MSTPGRRPHELPIAPDVRELRRRVRAGEAVLQPVTGADSALTEDPRGRRRELYVLLAVCLDRVTDDFVAAWPPQALPQLQEYPGAPPDWASAALCELLLETFDAFFAAPPNRWRDSQGAETIAPLLARIDACGPEVSSVLDRPRPHYAEQLMRAGMTTMAAVAPPILAAAARLASDDDDGDSVQRAADVAHRSVRIASQLAALGLDQVGLLQRELIDPDTMEFRDDSTLRLAVGSGGKRLELTRDTSPVSAASRWPSRPSYAHRIGCPTLVRTESDSALERLWAWTVRAAQGSGYFAARMRPGRAG